MVGEAGLALPAGAVQQPRPEPVRRAPRLQFGEQLFAAVEGDGLPAGLQQCGRSRRGRSYGGVGEVLELHRFHARRQADAVPGEGITEGRVVVEDVGGDDVEAAVPGVVAIGGHDTDQDAAAVHSRSGQPSPRRRSLGRPVRRMLLEVEDVLVADEAGAGVDPARQLLGLHRATGTLGLVRNPPRLARRTGQGGDQLPPPHRRRRGPPVRGVLHQHQRRVIALPCGAGPHHPPARRSVSPGVEHRHPRPHRAGDVGGGQNQPPADRVPRPRPARPAHPGKTSPLHPTPCNRSAPRYRSTAATASAGGTFTGPTR